MTFRTGGVQSLAQELLTARLFKVTGDAFQLSSRMSAGTADTYRTVTRSLSTA